MDLFCLPYAGGSSAIFSSWNRELNSQIRCVPIELSGRGRRFGDLFYANMEELVDDVFNIVTTDYELNSYAVFGHSMGGIIAYELAKKIEKSGLKMPEKVFVSATHPPIHNKSKKWSGLPDDEFMECLTSLGGIGLELLNNREFLDLYIPILKADFSVIENYQFNHKDRPISTDLVIFNATNDSYINREKLYDWATFTSKDVSFHEFDGNHFFINEQSTEVIRLINQQLQNAEQNMHHLSLEPK